jgi:hypothetical protein
MEQHPLLSDYGIGVYDPFRKRTTEQRQAELVRDRASLIKSEARIQEVTAWLYEHVKPIKTTKISSYGMKHVVERITGVYISNGEFIAAALIAGYPYKYEQPNVLFGMSNKDVTHLQKLAHTITYRLDPLSTQADTRLYP